MYKLFDNCHIVVGDEEKSLAGLFLAGGLAENMPRRDFDEVSGGEMVVIEQALVIIPFAHCELLNCTIIMNCEL